MEKCVAQKTSLAEDQVKEFFNSIQPDVSNILYVIIIHIFLCV